MTPTHLAAAAGGKGRWHERCRCGTTWHAQLGPMYALLAVPEASTAQDRQPTLYRCSSSQVFTRASSCAEHSAPGCALLRCWQTSWQVATVDVMTGVPGAPARRGPGT